jgi:Fungalysin metallopeptidase (M36)
MLRIRHGREVPGRNYSTPKEIWGFRLAPQKGLPMAVARDVLAANSARLGLDGILRELHARRRIASAGAWHVIFSQTHLGRFIHRAYVTVHMDRQKCVYLVKNRAVPARILPPRADVRIDPPRAARIALGSVGKRAGGARVTMREDVWFPRRTRLYPAYKLRVQRRRPAGEWIVYVDATSGAVLWKYDNLAAASAARARVFDPNPVVMLGDWRTLLRKGKPLVRLPVRTYKTVSLRGLSTSGLLDGPRVSTAPTRNRVRRRGRDFRCFSYEAGFEEVMAYYHVDRAVRYLESLGYRGERAIFHDPIRVNARATRDDNSWYMPSSRELGFGTGAVDDAEDGETILHELGHALQDAICPDFGQSPEAAAMGEGFGDYLAGSYFAARKTAAAQSLLPCVMTWDGILLADGTESNRPPCVRRLDSGLTYESFDYSATADEHANGEIWSATLWDIWSRLGRDRADRLIIESHFQLDGFTSFAKGARAIVDADRNLFRGRHVTALKRIFRRRGIGPVE